MKQFPAQIFAQPVSLTEEELQRKNLGGFPEGFLWGAATAAHQAEGWTRNDWSEWEKKNAERLAQKAETKFGHLPNWPDIKTQAQDPANYISGSACDHYNRYEADFDIARSLGHNAHRFCIEWSRIEPAEGVWDEKEIEHYRNVIRALRERGMEPFVTLWHWPLPLWLAEKGGWAWEKTPEYFVRYAERLSKEFKDVRFWLTLNEPSIYAGHVYIKAAWPHGTKNPFLYWQVLNRFISAHKGAYQAIKKNLPSAQVSLAYNQSYFEAYQGKIVNRLLKKIADWFWNDYFLEKINGFRDFIGLNHYHHSRINYGFNRNENKKVSDMGWELYPESIYHVLIGLKKYNLPIYITENGLADSKDAQREWFIRESLSSVHKAIQEGADVRGYLHWSLLDNFEWDKGFWPRFGLVEIDYATQKRTIRPSAYAYAKIIKNNSIDF